MAQVKFKTPNNLEVLAGWDFILNYFFLVIEDLSDPDKDYIFSNMRENLYPEEFDPFSNKIHELNISVPPFFETIVNRKDPNSVCWTWDSNKLEWRIQCSSSTREQVIYDSHCIVINKIIEEEDKTR